MRVELQNVDYRVAKIENTLQQLANVLVLTARQDERLMSIGWSRRQPRGIPDDLQQQRHPGYVDDNNA
jgi:hypothetical protein